MGDDLKAAVHNLVEVARSPAEGAGRNLVEEAVVHNLAVVHTPAAEAADHIHTVAAVEGDKAADRGQPEHHIGLVVELHIARGGDRRRCLLEVENLFHPWCHRTSQQHPKAFLRAFITLALEPPLGIVYLPRDQLLA